MAVSSSINWAEHLNEGEEILWQGQPYSGLRMKRGDGLPFTIGLIVLTFGGLGLVGVYFYVMHTDNQLTFRFYFISFVIAVVFFGGLYNVFLRFVFAAYKRRKTCYAVTNRRLLTLIKGQFEAEPLHADIYLEYVPGTYASLYFKKTARRETVHSHSKRGKSHVVTLYDYKGFELIEDGEAAYQAVRSVMNGRPARAEPTAAHSTGRWENVLHDDETLLWTGQPSAGWAPSKAKGLASLLGLYLLYLIGPHFLNMVMLTFSDPYGFTRIIPSLFLVIPGVFLAVGPWIYGRKKRRATYYALSNKRAFVSCSFGKRQMLAHALAPGFHPVWTEGNVHSVSFGEEDAFNRKGAEIKVPLAFKELEDGSEVYSILSNLSQKMDAEAAQ